MQPSTSKKETNWEKRLYFVIKTIGGIRGKKSRVRVMSKEDWSREEKLSK